MKNLEQMRNIREDLDLTQKEVGNAMRMTQQQYSRFENGVFELNYDQILFLCKLYEITPNELFSIND